MGGISVRFNQPGWLSGGVHFIILAIAVQAESAAVWPYALLAMSAVSFFAWAANYRRYRQLQDVPTSNVATAAQGYVELAGKSELMPNRPVRSKLSQQICCWHSWQVERKSSDDKWRTVDEGRSDEPFVLRDESGTCVIEPAGSEFMTRDQKSWLEGSYRYTESLLLPDSVVCAIGEFSTTTAEAIDRAAEKGEITALILQWKADQQKLNERFDLNRDGIIDLKEWELARIAAAREVRRRRSASPAVTGTHHLRKPDDGRLFLIANELPDALGKRYQYWSWAHLVVMFIAGGIGIGLW